MFTYIMRYIKDKLRFVKYSDTTPQDYMNSDIYIVEFPRSGITWLSTIMTNINFKLLNMDKQVSYFNVVQHVPDIHHINRVGRQLSENLGFRLIKSHSRYNPYYRFIILLIRNPCDVMVSFYKFMQDSGYNDTIENFIKDERFGIKSWIKHTESWLNGSPKGEKIHVIKYENLKKQPMVEIKALYKNIGFNLDEKIISEAVLKSSFNAMKESEELFREFNPKHVRKFVRKGDSNYNLANEEKEYIIKHSKHLLEKYFPEILDEC